MTMTTHKARTAGNKETIRLRLHVKPGDAAHELLSSLDDGQRRSFSLMALNLTTKLIHGAGAPNSDLGQSLLALVASDGESDINDERVKTPHRPVTKPELPDAEPAAAQSHAPSVKPRKTHSQTNKLGEMWT
jgi:hypothetical protein